MLSKDTLIKVHKVTSEILEDGLSLKLKLEVDVMGFDDEIVNATLTYNNISLLPIVETFDGENKAHLPLVPKDGIIYVVAVK